MLQCCYCSKKFKYESEKKRHEKSHDPQFKCDKCSKKFSFLSALKRHQKQHERTGSVKCADCGKYFLDNILLKRHIKYAHKGTYICPKCNAIFSSEQALVSHQKSHKPRSERRFQCSYERCGKSFNYIHHLKHHELTHSDDKQHFCNVCGKGFIQYHHLKSHIKTHSPDDWLLCTTPGCYKRFPDEYSRKRHISKHKIIDSAISSDSNYDFSNDDMKNSRDKLLCASCGDLVQMTSYNVHTEQCETNKPDDLRTNIKHPSNINEQIETFNNSVLDIFIDDKNYNMNQIKTDSSVFYNSVVESFGDLKAKQVPTKRSKATCEGCDCYSKDPNPNSVPQIEYRSNGVIKLKDTLEPDIVDICKSNKIENEEFYTNDVPYNSCKSVLGKCIVSGSGTISDECLCAKMALTEQDLEQEIDEITPRPIMSIG